MNDENKSFDPLDMSNYKTSFLYFFLKINHEQSSTLRHDIIFVTNISEWIIEICSC